MPILSINCNAKLLELMGAIPSGQVRKYIYNENPKKKLDTQIYICNSLMLDGYTPYIEVKFVSQYSSRERRIEVIGIKDNSIHLFQLSSRSSFDQDANDLERLIKEIETIEEASSFKISGTIALTNKGNDLETLETALTDMGLSINIIEI